MSIQEKAGRLMGAASGIGEGLALDGGARESAAEQPGFRPLYRQVKDVFLKRIGDGQWQPGMLIPSEFQIAAELGVSQGTVRKALDEMTAENLLVRRQGKGTYVARHDEARILFQFFKVEPDAGGKVFPESTLLSVETAIADIDECRVLRLAAGERAIRIARLRSLNGQVAISELISLPARLFPGLGAEIPVENNLYQLFATRFGVTIAGGVERLKAVAAGLCEVDHLGVEEHAPLLLIDRIANAVDGTPAEWRRSLLNTAHAAYVSALK